MSSRLDFHACTPQPPHKHRHIDRERDCRRAQNHHRKRHIDHRPDARAPVYGWARNLDDVVGHRLDPALFVGAIFLFHPGIRADDDNVRLFLGLAEMNKADWFWFWLIFVGPSRPVPKHRTCEADLQVNGLCHCLRPPGLTSWLVLKSITSLSIPTAYLVRLIVVFKILIAIFPASGKVVLSIAIIN